MQRRLYVIRPEKYRWKTPSINRTRHHRRNNGRVYTRVRKEGVKRFSYTCSNSEHRHTIILLCTPLPPWRGSPRKERPRRAYEIVKDDDDRTRDWGKNIEESLCNVYTDNWPSSSVGWLTHARAHERVPSTTSGVPHVNMVYNILAIEHILVECRLL